MAAFVITDLVKDSAFTQRYDPEIGSTVYVIERDFFVGGLTGGSSYAIQMAALSVSGVPLPYIDTHPTVTDAYCTSVRVVGVQSVNAVKLVATYTQIPNQQYIPAEWATNLESEQVNTYGPSIPTAVAETASPGDKLFVVWHKHDPAVLPSLAYVGTATKLQAAGVLSFTQFVSGAGSAATVDGYLASFNGGCNNATWRSFPELSWMCTISAKQIFPTAFRVQWNFVLRPPYLSGDPIGGWWDQLTFTSRDTDGQIPANFKRNLVSTAANGMLAAYIYPEVDYSTLPAGIA